MAMEFNIREKLEGLDVRLSNGIKSAIFLDVVIEFCHVQLSEQPVVLGHSVDSI